MPESPEPLARRSITLLLRSRVVNGAVRALAHARGHRLVLVYHGVGQLAPPGCQVVPSVATEMFRAHVQALGEVVDVVSLDDILAQENAPPRVAARRARLSVALTLDDDLPSHMSHALPALRDLGVPAAFFLSGRALYGLGPYWFQQMEALLVSHGCARVAGLLGMPTAPPSALALSCEQSPEMRRRVAELSADVPQPGVLQRADIAALSAAGMTIGFHTLDHVTLPALDDAGLETAVTRGRDCLAAAAGAAARFFSYPHGKADARTAQAVRRAGFEAAFTGRPGPLRRRQDRFLLGRWDPGPLGVDALLAKLAIHLHRASPAIAQAGPGR